MRIVVIYNSTAVIHEFLSDLLCLVIPLLIMSLRFGPLLVEWD